MKDFSAFTRSALAAKGIHIMGLIALPDANGSFANCQRGYRVNDNGCGRIWTHAEVITAAA